MLKPVILLAFANNPDSPPLPALEEERISLVDLLSSEMNVQAKPKATLERIQQAFNTYGHQVRVFHFAGHANEKQIELEIGKDGRKGGYVAGVARYIGLQKGIELVFLNGCSTQGQVNHFIKSGVPAVISTIAPINDQIAKQFAELFYTSFILSKHKKTLRESFDETHAQLLARVENKTDLFSRRLSLKELEEVESNDVYKLSTSSLAIENLCFEDLFVHSPDKQSVPPKAHLLCNRDDQNDDFKDIIKDQVKAKEEKKPLICLVHGAETELPLALCRRFSSFSVEKIFKSLDMVIESSRIEHIEVEMPRKRDFSRKEKAMDKARESLKYALDMDLIPATEIRSMKGQDVVKALGNHPKIALFQHNLYSEDWDSIKSVEFLTAYLSDFWQLSLSEGNPQIILLFSLQFPRQKGFFSRFRRVNRQIEDCFRSFSVKILDQLQEVDRVDVKKWNDRYAGDDPKMTDRLFGKKATLPMEEIFPELESAVKRRRKLI